MGHPETDLSQITVPTEDEAIPRAFAQLESNISAWSGAIADAQRMLEQLVEQAHEQQAAAEKACAQAREAQAREAQAKGTQAEGTQAAVQTTSAKAGDKQTPEAQPVEKARPATADANAPPKYTREMAHRDTEQSNKSRGKGLAGRFKRKQVDDEVANSAANDASVADSKSDDPDETLLATLDEKTAQAIRIKRRLLNKSVRELLDEMK